MFIRKSKDGDALVLVVGLLALFLVATLTYLILGRTGAKIAGFSLQEVKAKEMAETGIAEAVLRLKDDLKNEFLSDHYEEPWHENFLGDEVDNDEDGINESRWFLVKKGERIIGKYAVLVEDESSKINLNAAGNISCSGHQGVNEGWKMNEINLHQLPGLGPELAENICLWRHGDNRFPGSPYDDDGDNPLSADGIDNNANGIIDESNENFNEPDEFRHEKPYDDDRPFLSLEELKEVSGIGSEIYQGIKNLCTIFSYDKNIDGKGEARINLNLASLREIEEGLRRSGFTNEAQIYQIAVNIKDFRDKDTVPSLEIDAKGNFYYGLEETPYLNEIEAAPDLELKQSGTITTFWWSKGEFIELFNSYQEDIPIGNWRISVGNLVSVPIKPDGVIPARGYYTIGDSLSFFVTIIPAGCPPIIITPVYTPVPDGCDQYWKFLELPMAGSKMTLFDADGNVIEATRYGPDIPGKATRQKNDPRMRGILDWFPGPASPNKQNLLFLPETGLEVHHLNWGGHFVVKNNPFSQVGELGYIHQMSQWQTINLWQEKTPASSMQGQAPDLKTQDIFTVAEPVKEWAYGRININTAPISVLLNLPFLTLDEANAIINGRPYSEIGLSGPKLNNVSSKLRLWGCNFKDDDQDGYVDEDDEKELSYRRISNLITVRSNLFRIISTGQVVEDFDGNGKIEEKEILAEKKVIAVYDRGRKFRKFVQWKVR
ncbi:MAG: hypothetical protein V2A65_02795 [Candidatus Omnitrophota bacterium]